LSPFFAFQRKGANYSIKYFVHKLLVPLVRGTAKQPLILYSIITRDTLSFMTNITASDSQHHCSLTVRLSPTVSYVFSPVGFWVFLHFLSLGISKSKYGEENISVAYPFFIHVRTL
jgi:hypothetical protein